MDFFHSPRKSQMESEGIRFAFLLVVIHPGCVCYTDSREQILAMKNSKHSQLLPESAQLSLVVG